MSPASRPPKTVYVGRNLFSGWQYETQENWDDNDAFLRLCQKVESVECQCDDCERAPVLQPVGDDDIPF